MHHAVQLAFSQLTPIHQLNNASRFGVAQSKVVHVDISVAIASNNRGTISTVTSQVILTTNRQGMDPPSQELLPTPLYCVLDMVNKDPLIGPGQNISTNLVVDLSKDIGIG
jgi:hypothetical protein